MDSPQQTFNDLLRVGTDDVSTTDTSSEKSELRFDDDGYRKERTHSDDKFVIETPAPPTTAGAAGAEPTVTQSSRSDWALRESSDSELKFTVHATDTTSVLNGTKHHVRQDQTAGGDFSGMTLGYSGAEVAFSMGSDSGSSMQSTHRLDVWFSL